MSNGVELSGSCLCGAVEFQVSGPSLWCAHCHCTMCQRAHGAAFVTWVGVPEQSAALTGDSLHWFESSPGAQRGFCSRCGSSMFFRSRQWPGELHIVRANFFGEIDRPVDGNAFIQNHAGWFEIPGGWKRS